MNIPSLRALAVLLPVIAASSAAADPGNEQDRQRIASIVTQMEHADLRRDRRSDGDDTPSVVQPFDGGWIIDLGRGLFGQGCGSQVPAELDERLQAIRLEVILQREAAGAPTPGLDLQFDGQPLERCFDEPVQPGRPVAGQAPDVFISASHGYYLHAGATWKLQRPLVNGMVEDRVTPRFAHRLAGALHDVGLTTTLARSAASLPHSLASQPWWQMASRYHAQALYPGRPDIWRSYADRSSPLREYNDDIRTRPLMGNALGAGMLVHLHTNAASSPEASGAMAFYQPGRGEDRRLGHVLLCAMREAVHRLPRYRNYRVRVEPMTGNYGENRLALSPSILIELGFHTNPGDAAALQDPRFQQAVAEGLREGIVAFRAGKGRDEDSLCH